jgi:hypothetical protein
MCDFNGLICSLRVKPTNYINLLLTRRTAIASINESFSVCSSSLLAIAAFLLDFAASAFLEGTRILGCL